MQKGYTDHTDYDHLVETLHQDFKPLFNKIKKIELQLRSSVGTIKRQEFVRNDIIWESPLGKNQWTIHYNLLLSGKKIDINFFPYTLFPTINDDKAFLLLNKATYRGNDVIKSTLLQKKDHLNEKNYFKEFLSVNNISIIIFREHFIEQFRTRTINPDILNFEVMLEFGFNNKSVLVDDFIQKKKWVMSLHSKGIAMIKVQNNYIIFDTYITKNLLKDNQIAAISKYLAGVDDIEYGFIAQYLLNRSNEWYEFIDKVRLLKWLNNLASRDQNLARIFELYFQDFFKNPNIIE
jgi:hypothetical protein